MKFLPAVALSFLAVGLLCVAGIAGDLATVLIAVLLMLLVALSYVYVRSDGRRIKEENRLGGIIRGLAETVKTQGGELETTKARLATTQAESDAVKDALRSVSRELREARAGKCGERLAEDMTVELAGQRWRMQ